MTYAELPASPKGRVVSPGNFIHIQVLDLVIVQGQRFGKGKQSKSLNLHGGVGCLPLWHVCITLVNLQWG